MGSLDPLVLEEFSALVIEDYLQRKRLPSTQMKFREERSKITNDPVNIWYNVLQALEMYDEGKIAHMHVSSVSIKHKNIRTNARLFGTRIVLEVLAARGISKAATTCQHSHTESLGGSSTCSCPIASRCGTKSASSSASHERLTKYARRV